jgi:hypothetical protein
VVDIKGIPVGQVGALVEALMDQLPPTPQLLPSVLRAHQAEHAATVS